MKAIRCLLLPAALVTVVACQKQIELEIIPDPTPAQEETSLTFISERPQTDNATRTYWDGSTILWNDTDRIRMGYTVNGVWQNSKGDSSGDAKLYGSQGVTLTEEGAVAAFTIHEAFSGNTQGEHVFYAVFPGSATGTTMTDAPTTTVTVPSTQTPLADSFDPTADIMLGHSVDEFDARPTEPIKLVWQRVVAHGLITLKNLPGTVSGETVKTITLTAQTGANLTGAQEMDVVTGQYSPSAENTTSNRITVKGDNLSLDSSGNVSFWMSILPETLTSLTVEVVTNKATYTRSISGFTREFLANRRNILSINMSSATRLVEKPSSGDEYVLVESSADLSEGHYLLVYAPDDVSTAKVLSGKGEGNYGVAIDAPVSDNAISFDDAGAYDIEIKKTTATNWSLKQGDNYLGLTSNGNNLYFNGSFASSKYEWTISISERDATLTNVSYTGRRLQWNNASTGQRFACYSTDQQPVRLYKWVPAGPSVKTKAATEITVSSARLNATFGHLGTTNVQEIHFLWGESPDVVDQVVYAENFNVSAGAFHATLSSLEENKTYYYKAVMQYWDGETYQVLEGEVLSFKTASSATGGNAGLQWLGCYEIPAIDLVNQNSFSGRGEETFGSTYWYNYQTTASKRKVVTHTYSYNNKTYRNYTTMVDGDKRCPLWTAYVMHSGAYPDNGVGRVGSFNTSTSYDPGIPRAWQSSGSTDDYSTANYSRGHMIASSDRQAIAVANKQTFYYTNQAPQKQSGFNSGIWNSLEGDVQSHAPSGRDTLYVVVGTLFEDGNTGASNDGGTVARPSHFYKLLMKCSFNASGAMTDAKGIAYLYTNEDHSNDNGGNKVTYHDSRYVTTIDAIETRTGFNFFANVPTSLQDAAEGTATALWTY